MFGYITANLTELSQPEKDRYGEIYCGICRAMGKEASQLNRLGLRYDMAFLALTLLSTVLTFGIAGRATQAMMGKEEKPNDASGEH